MFIEIILNEISETAETPRPSRPFGTRFPVKPSLSGIDSAAVPSTSPEPPPPIPNRSHERMKSMQTQPQPQPRKPTLLSPPDPNAIPERTGIDDVTVRPKRHGMVTPRGAEGAAQQLALSPSALQEAFSSVDSRPHSRTGSNVSTASVATENILELSKLVYNAANELSKRLNSQRPMLEWQNQVQLKAQVELDLRTGSSRIDILGRYLGRAQQESGQPLGRRPTYLVKPVMECLASVSQFSRSLGQCSASYCRTSNYETYKGAFWEVQKDAWEVFIANSKFSDAIRSVNHSRQTSTSSQYRHGRYGDPIRPTVITSMFDVRNQPSRNGLNPSPTNLAYSGSMHQSQNPSLSSNIFSPIPSSAVLHQTTFNSSVGGRDGTYSDESRQDIDNNLLWDMICQALKILCERAIEGLPRIQRHYYNERQKAIRIYDQDHEIVRQLSSLVARTNQLIDVANQLNIRLENVKSTDKSMRQSMEFWQLVRTLIMVRRHLR
jgi:hypothetical protein